MKEVEKVLAKVWRKRKEESNLYSNFEKRYQEKEYVKASELLWGSVSNITIAIGLLYERKLGKHRRLVDFMRELAQGDPKVGDWINAAESLHSNFYNNWMEERVFKDNAAKVINLRFWLSRILEKRIIDRMH